MPVAPGRNGPLRTIGNIGTASFKPVGLALVPFGEQVVESGARGPAHDRVPRRLTG